MLYIHFTEEQKQHANNVDLAEFLRHQGEDLLPSGREKRLASDHSITICGNQWFDHAAERGGGAISFVQQFYGLTYPEAVTRLLGGEHGTVCPAKTQEQKKAPAFVLPPANSNMHRVYAYLLKQRFIDRDVLTEFVSAGLIYESCEPSPDGMKEYHNAVFVGFDEHGVARHAHKRGLSRKSYRGNVIGSGAQYSFHYIGQSNQLYVFEAPIDLLSFITLHPQDWQEHSYLALCGTSARALLWMLQQYPYLDRICLCLDHDAAGIEAAGRLTELLQTKNYADIRLWVSEYKDWNADLKARHGLPAEPAEEHPQLVAALPICEQIAKNSMTENADHAQTQLPLLLQAYKHHFSLGHIEHAVAQLEAASALALAAALRERRQLGLDTTEQTIAKLLYAQILPHQNRRTLQNRSVEIAAEFQNVLSQSASSDILTQSEKEKLADAWLHLSVSCAKALVKYAADQMTQQQNEKTGLLPCLS